MSDKYFKIKKGLNIEPTSVAGSVMGDIRVDSSTGALKVYNGVSEVTNSADVSLAAVGSSPNANGASLTGQVLTLQPADGTNPGLMSALAQTLGGDKTFLNRVLLSDGLLASPSLTFANSLNVGFYLTGVSSFGIGADGTLLATLSDAQIRFRGNDVNPFSIRASIEDSTGLYFWVDGSNLAVLDNTASSGGISIQTNSLQGFLLSNLGVLSLGRSGSSATHAISGNALQFLGSSSTINVDLTRGTTDGSISLSGDTGAADGAAIKLFGGAHATDANLLQVFNGGSQSLSIAASGAHNIGKGGSSVSHQINGDALTTVHSSSTGLFSILRDVNSGGLVLGGGSSGANGGSIRLDGSTSSGPNKISIRLGSTDVFTIDSAGVTILTTTSGFGINATPNTTNIFLMRRDQNSLLRTIVTNFDTGSGASVQTSLSTDAGDLNIQATSLAGGALGYIATDSTFTGGLRIATNGANPLELRTNNQTAVIIDGTTQNAVFSAAISASNLSGTNSGDITLAAFGSSPNANGASLSGQILTLQPASTSFSGGVSTGVQSFAGVKTFTDNLNISKTSADPVFSINAITSGNPQIYWNGNTRDWTMAVNGSTGLFSIARGTSVAVGDFNISAAGNTSITNNLSVGGVLLNSAGSAAAPSYSFTGDSDTGIFNRAANQIGFSVNGAEVGFTNGDWSLGLNNSSVVTFIGRTLVGNGSPVSAGAFNIINAVANGQTFISGGSSVTNGGAIRLDGGSSGGSNAVSFQYNGTDMGYFGGAGLDFTVLNHIRASNGTVGLPSISFTNGSTNGFYLTGSGSFGVSAGGIQMGSFGSAVQLVGSQSNPLLIKGDISNSTAVAIYHDNSGDANIQNQYNGNLILGTNGSNFFTGSSAATTIGIFRVDRNARTAISVINGNAGSDAEAQYALTNDADDARLLLSSIAGGNLLNIISNSGITGGIRVTTFGAHPFEVRTNNDTAIYSDGVQNVQLGNWAISTTSTDGFPYIPAASGAPTGVPTSKSGFVPMYYDTANDNFYIYRGGWKKVTLT